MGQRRVPHTQQQQHLCLQRTSGSGPSVPCFPRLHQDRSMLWGRECSQYCSNRQGRRGKARVTCLSQCIRGCPRGGRWRSFPETRKRWINGKSAPLGAGQFGLKDVCPVPTLTGEDVTRPTYSNPRNQREQRGGHSVTVNQRQVGSAS